MEICYLIAFPDADDGKPPLVEPFKGLKDAPYFQPIDIDLVTLGEETVLIEGHAVAVTRQPVSYTHLTLPTNREV